jgi:hypothetical protein
VAFLVEEDVAFACTCAPVPAHVQAGTSDPVHVGLFGAVGVAPQGDAPRSRKGTLRDAWCVTRRAPFDTVRAASIGGTNGARRQAHLCLRQVQAGQA